ncbi:MAG: antibiotic biosynthesis monooxygenase [Actinobacteria bacterium]|nr:antibiotic biosynthesis monooxygenase [Actinomycetota bacterium]
MVIVHVFANVKPDMVNDFKKATRENAQNSIKEPGILRFDVMQQEEDPSSFLLIEVYRDNNAAAQHKETAHYLKWRDTVALMMTVPRKAIRYLNIFPDEKDW